MTFDLVPEVFRYPEDIFGCVELGGSDLWSGCDGVTPELEALFEVAINVKDDDAVTACLLYTSPSPRDVEESRMPSSA